jgi:cytochrome P450 family 135
MATASSALPAVQAPADKLPPGPRISPFLQTVAWSFAPTWVMDRCAARFGETFTLTFSPSRRQMVVVSNPEAVKTIFTAPPDVAPSATGATPIAPIMGPNSVLTLTGPAHLRQRRLLLPPFHGERMREYEQVIVAATKRDMASWALNEPMRLSERTRAITLDVILRAVFGVEGKDMEAMRRAISGLLAPMGMPRMVLLALRNSTEKRPDGAIGRALDDLDTVIYDELSRRRAQSDLEQRSDILSLLLLARDEDGQAMTDNELRDELVTLLLAGHETTATAVAWAIERLVRHPDKLARLTAEIDAGDGEEYLQAVVSETLRVRPVVPLVIRVLTEPLRVGGHELPEGTRVVPSIHLTNRNPRVYEMPDEFRPERFLENSPETFSWIPFGGGIRRCIGASFATLEMKLMLSTMLSELQPSLRSQGRRTLRGRLFARGEWNRRRAITLVPAAGARVVWSKRTK